MPLWILLPIPLVLLVLLIIRWTEKQREQVPQVSERPVARWIATSLGCLLLSVLLVRFSDSSRPAAAYVLFTGGFLALLLLLRIAPRVGATRHRPVPRSR
jgi:hypothetical protein